MQVELEEIVPYALAEPMLTPYLVNIWTGLFGRDAPSNEELRKAFRPDSGPWCGMRNEIKKNEYDDIAKIRARYARVYTALDEPGPEWTRISFEQAQEAFGLGNGAQVRNDWCDLCLKYESMMRTCGITQPYKRRLPRSWAQDLANRHKKRLDVLKENSAQRIKWLEGELEHERSKNQREEFES